MKRTLLPCQSDNLEENEINLVLEQLQENGFSSFFDHPDCPFSSIQEVDEALKELEKEFLKICHDKETKPTKLHYRSRATVGPSPSSSTLNNLKLKNKLKEYRNKSTYKIESCETNNRKEARKRIGNCLKSGSKSMDNSLVNSECSDRDKYVGLASGDTKEVCAIDSSGNKYSLKIEVFATVKLENEDSDKSILKLEQSQSSPKIKARKSVTSVAQTKKYVETAKKDLKMTRDEGENCPPLLLSYRSSMCKPCPSYINPTASDLRKTATYLRAKPEPSPIKPDSENLKFAKNNISDKTFNQVNQAIDNVQTEEIEKSQSHPSGSIFEEKNFVNYSATNNQNCLIKTKENIERTSNFESLSIQTINLDCNSNESNKLGMTSFDVNDGKIYQYDQTPTLSQEQQTSFEILKTLIEQGKENVLNTSDNCFKCGTVDEGVNTSALSMFNLSRITQGVSNIIADGSCNITTLKQEMSRSDISCCQDFTDDQIVKNVYIKSNSKNERPRLDISKRSISDELLSREVVCVDIGTGCESTELLVTNNPDVIVSNKELLRSEIEHIDTILGTELAESEIDKSDERVPLDSSSKETVIMRSNGSILKDKDRLTTILEESANSADLITNTSSYDLISKIDVGVGQSNEFILVIDKRPILVDREVDCKSKPSVTHQDNSSSMSVESKNAVTLDMLKGGSKEKQLVDKEVWMSKEVIGKSLVQNMIDKEVHMSNWIIKNKSTMMDKEIGARLYRREFTEQSDMVDKDVETMVESKSMFTFIDETLRIWSDKGIATGLSEHSVDSSTNAGSSDLSWVRDSSSDQESPKRETRRSDLKFNKWPGSKTFGAKFKRSDPKAFNSEKVMKIIRERREKRKSDEGSSKKESITKRNKLKQDQIDKDDSLNSTSSTEQTRKLSGYQKSKEMSEHETKFVKGVFSRYGSAGKNKIAMKRRAFSNLDQKILASRLARSKKSMGTLKSSKKSMLEQSKSHRSDQPQRDKSNSLSITSTSEYILPDNTVINVEE